MAWTLLHLNSHLWTNSAFSIFGVRNNLHSSCIENPRLAIEDIISSFIKLHGLKYMTAADINSILDSHVEIKESDNSYLLDLLLLQGIRFNKLRNQFCNSVMTNTVVIWYVY